MLWDSTNLCVGCSITEYKRPGCEADNSPPCSAEFWNVWSYILVPPFALTTCRRT